MSLSKPRPILNDMPYHIKKAIVDSIPLYLHRLPLRKVSKEFFRLVEAAEFEMELSLGYKETLVENGAIQLTILTTVKEAIDHFKCFVAKPKATFSKFMINGDQPIFGELMEMLTATVTRPLRVKHFRMMNAGEARILELLEPGTLDTIALLFVDPAEAEKIFQMEQWRQARFVELTNVAAACESWWDFPKFQINYNPSVDLPDLPRILEHVMNSERFESGEVFNSYWSIQDITDALGGDGWEMKQEGAGRVWSQKMYNVGNRVVLVKAFDKLLVVGVSQ